MRYDNTTTTTAAELQMHNIVNAYVEQLDTSSNTAMNYRNMVLAFLRWCDENGREVTTDTLIIYKHKLTDEHKTASTINTMLAAVRSFCRFRQIPLYRVASVKDYQYAKRAAAPAEEVKQAIATEKDKQTRIMLVLALYCGLRSCEIQKLHARDIVKRADGIYLAVTGKGYKGISRYQPVPNVVVPLLLDYIDGLLAEEPLFVSSSPNSRMQQLGVRSIQARITGAFGGKYTTHQLRHTYALIVLQSTNNLATTAELLGHKNLQTTKRYTHEYLDTMKAQAINNINW